VVGRLSAVRWSRNTDSSSSDDAGKKPRHRPGLFHATSFFVQPRRLTETAKIVLCATHRIRQRIRKVVGAAVSDSGAPTMIENDVPACLWAAAWLDRSEGSPFAALPCVRATVRSPSEYRDVSLPEEGRERPPAASLPRLPTPAALWVGQPASIPSIEQK